MRVFTVRRVRHPARSRRSSHDLVAAYCAPSGGIVKTYPTSPPTRLEAWLLNLDPDHFAAIVTGFIVLLFLLCMIPSIVVRLGKTRPASSDHKAGRVRL